MINLLKLLHKKNESSTEVNMKLNHIIYLNLLSLSDGGENIFHKQILVTNMFSLTFFKHTILRIAIINTLPSVWFEKKETSLSARSVKLLSVPGA